MNLHNTDFWSGIFLLALGLIGIHGALQLDLGSARNMGPGYYPMLAAAAVTLCGLVMVALAALSDERARDLWALDWGPLISVSLSGIVFGLLVARAGLIPAIFGSVVVATFADRRLSIVATTLLCLGLGLISYLIFVQVLGLPTPAFRMPKWN